EGVVGGWGEGIEEVGASGIFRGEVLPKNFGVTRHGRVVCYDYDELSLLTDFCFRDMPVARVDDDEYADEAWFGVGPRDVFPEEFSRFLMLPPELRAVLEESHGRIFQPAFWREMQSRVSGGGGVGILSYPQAPPLPAD